jgi:hypothetical protein
VPVVTFQGPFFTLGAKPLQEALDDVTQDIVERGERMWKGQLYPGHGLLTGHLRRSISGEVRGRLRGEITDSGVIYGAWVEGTSRRNRTTRFKGYSAARRTTRAIQRMVPRLAERHIRKAIRRMNG